MTRRKQDTELLGLTQGGEMDGDILKGIVGSLMVYLGCQDRGCHGDA